MSVSTIFPVVPAASEEGSVLQDPGTQTYSAFAPGATSHSGIRINTDSTLDERQNASYIERATWLTGGSPSDYEVRATVVSGTIDGGDSTGAWLSLSSAREWYIQTETVETDTAGLTVSIRHAVNTSDSISFSVNLSAQEDTL